MDYRQDLFPPLLALAFSLGLHGALFGVEPLWWEHPPPEPVDVVVQFLDETAAPGLGPAAPATPGAPPPKPSPPVLPRPEASNPPPPAPPPEALAGPAPPVVEVATPEAPPDPPQPAAPEAPPPSTGPETTAEPEPETAPPLPTISELLPRPSDLKRFVGKSELPDPTAAGVREATLSLGNEDLRYRGYLETVHAAIDRSEKWKEAVLMGGGGGVVVVRMTITSLGQLVSASITQSSGSHLLDSAALDAVQRAQMPPFPAHWQIEKLHLHAQFNYQLVTY